MLFSERNESVTDGIDAPFFFIVGSQRSGTTLLRLILNHHSDISIPTEATFLMPLLRENKILNHVSLTRQRKEKLVNYLRRNSQFAKWQISDEVFDVVLQEDLSVKQFVVFLYKEFARKEGKKICGDKSPTFIRKLDVLAKAFPVARYIFIVRDGRDTFLSLRRKKAVGTASAALSAFEWSLKQSLVEKALKEIPEEKICRVRYEDLVRAPEKVVEQLCRFLDIPFDENMLNFWADSEKHIAKHHSDLIFKPINAENIEKWRSEMGEEENQKYSYFAGSMLRKYEYQVKDVRVSCYQKVLWYLEIICCLPQRLFRIFFIASFMRVASTFGLKADSKFYD